MIRLRRMLDDALQAPVWPAGFSLRTFEAADAPDVHALLTRVFDDGDDGPFEEWWPGVRTTPSSTRNCSSWSTTRRPARGRRAGLDQRIPARSGRRPDARRLGLAEALMWHVFAVFQQRGAAHVDLKTNIVVNADAARLYRRLGMVEVAWDG